MATTSLNLHCLSSSFSNSSSFTFQIPRKTTQLACFVHCKRAVFAHPLDHLSLGYELSKSLHFVDAPTLKTRLSRDLIVAQATEVAASNLVEESASEPKPKKKKKIVKYPRRVLDLYNVLQYPIITEAAIKNIADENTLLFTVDVRADKKMIRDAVINLFGVKVRKVNTSIRPDGTKKAHIMLNKENNASDLAKRIGIFPSSD